MYIKHEISTGAALNGADLATFVSHANGRAKDEGIPAEEVAYDIYEDTDDESEHIRAVFYIGTGEDA